MSWRMQMFKEMSSLFLGRASIGCFRVCSMDQASRIEERPNRNDPEVFQRLAEPFRRELKLHCYRMLGSLSDAEDLVQETFLRAWRGLDEFEGRGHFRGWLYRIATNACLNALASRASARRVLPESQGPPSDRMPAVEPASEIAWLEPYPYLGLEGIADTAQGPDARYELRETVQLAFVAVIQHLPPRQRAVLLLCDVMGWSARETARLLEASAASVNSALQRARATLAKRFPAVGPSFRRPRTIGSAGCSIATCEPGRVPISINLSRFSARMPFTACRRGATGIVGARQFGPSSDGPGDPTAAFVLSLHPLTCNRPSPCIAARRRVPNGGLTRFNDWGCRTIRSLT